MSASFLRIGPFSRASSLSIKALRAYHEQGLLVPAEIDRLQRGLDEPALHTPIHERDEPARHALMRDGTVSADEFGAFLDESFTHLFDVAARLGADTVDVLGDLYPQEIADDVGEAVVAYVAIAAPVPVPAALGVRLGEVPATRVASAVHLGGYADIGETYRHLGRWVAEHSAPRALAVRERYVVAAPAPEDEFVTEIHWPVEGPHHQEQP